MQSRRQFIQQSALAGMMLTVSKTVSSLLGEDRFFSYTSDYLMIRLRKDRPEFDFFSTDSLGRRQFSINPLLETAKQKEGAYKSQLTKDSITWHLHETPEWQCEMRPRAIVFRTWWKEGASPDPFEITFAQRANHCTVLGTMAGEKQMRFPCILHFPDMGTFRLHCSDPSVTLFYDSELTEVPYIKIGLPGAGAEHRDIRYTFESVAIYPEIRSIVNDNRYDGFRKNFINIFQFNPRRKVLSNNSTSDACAFTVFLYAEMARKTPPLCDGLTAMDLIRDTLDQYLNGVLGYGMVGKPNWQSEYNSSDCFPSLVMAAAYYILDTQDEDWANRNYEGIRNWAKKIIATDTNNDGIIEYGYSGNSGSWSSGNFKRPANWWDTIGFGHDDAYANALAYRALVMLSEVAGLLNKRDDQHYFKDFADLLKSNFYRVFYNPETGVLAGWRSADGHLHDYYFTFINSIAVCYDLVDREQGARIMKAMMKKMEDVDYTDFHLGLPGNLIPIADEDYAVHEPRWGYQHFQVYENGGATGCYVYYTVHALLKLGMRKEAEKIYWDMLESYRAGDFSGSCPGGKMTKDWKTWKGECWGYEGFLVDNYLGFLNVLDYLGK